MLRCLFVLVAALASTIVLSVPGADASSRAALGLPIHLDTGFFPSHSRALKTVASGPTYCGLYSKSCTSQDIRTNGVPTVSCLSNCGTTSGQVTCTAGTFVSVLINAPLLFNANSPRYDFVYTTRISANNCTAEVASTVVGKFKNLDGDQCFDLDLGGGGDFTYQLEPITIPCNDVNGDGLLDWNVCFGFDTSPGNDCSGPQQAVNKVSNSKCKCQNVPLPITVVACGAQSCPAWRVGTGPWPTDSTAGDLCVNTTGQCFGSDNCNGQTTGGWCVPKQGPSGLLSCFYSYKPATTTCRQSAGACDVAETCTGTSSTCPGDVLRPSTFECRASAGPCDVAENCTGTTTTCPGNTFQLQGTVCRPSLGCCDPKESCTGTSSSCPADAKADASFICLQTFGAPDADCGSAQTVTCDGTNNDCPSQATPPVKP